MSVAGIGVAGGALIALLISEKTRPLFGFMEQGYRIEIVIALVSEAAAIIFLGGFLVLAWARARGPRATRPAAGDRRARPVKATNPRRGCCGQSDQAPGASPYGLR